jgi:hypothetical protein
VTENQLADEEISNPGGLAPADRQCNYTKSDGHRCRAWVLRGHDHCFGHHRYLHSRPERPIDVPLLEDEASIVYLLSQTLQALAWGTIPVSNGHALLNGCRLAHSMQTQRLEAAKFRVKLRRLGIPEHEIFDPSTSSEHEAANTNNQPAPGAPCPDPSPIPNPKRERSSHLSFRDLKKNWDKDLSKVESEMTDMFAPRYKETREEFNAARATPFENLAQQDLAIQNIVKQSRAKEETLSIASLP